MLHSSIKCRNHNTDYQRLKADHRTTYIVRLMFVWKGHTSESCGIRYLLASWIQGFTDASIRVVHCLSRFHSPFFPFPSSIRNCYPRQIQPCLIVLSVAFALNCPHSDGLIQFKTTLSLLPSPQPQILFLEHGIACLGTYPSGMKEIVRRKKLILLWVWVAWARRVARFWMLMRWHNRQRWERCVLLSVPSGF